MPLLGYGLVCDSSSYIVRFVLWIYILWRGIPMCLSRRYFYCWSSTSIGISIRTSTSPNPTTWQSEKNLFHITSERRNLSLNFDTKETVIELNGVHIEAYPSHHLDAIRGLPNVSFIFLDEADFFPPGQQQDARDVSERYIAKSNPWIVMVSTPNAPDGLFEWIERESEDTCL